MGDEARRGRRLPPPGGSLVSAWVRAAFAARFCVSCAVHVALWDALSQGWRAHGLGGHPPRSQRQQLQAVPRSDPATLPSWTPRHGGRAGLVGTQGASVLPVPLHKASGAWLGLCAHREAPGSVSWAYFGFRLPTHHILGGSRARVCGSHSHVWLLASASPAPAIVGICGVNWQVEALSASFK